MKRGCGAGRLVHPQRPVRGAAAWSATSPPVTPTAWTRSPVRAAVPTPPAAPQTEDSPLAGYGLRGVGDGPRGRRGRRSLTMAAVLAAARRHEGPQEADRLSMGTGHSHALYVHGTRRCTPSRPRTGKNGHCPVSSSRRGDAARGVGVGGSCAPWWWRPSPDHRLGALVEPVHLSRSRCRCGTRLGLSLSVDGLYGLCDVLHRTLRVPRCCSPAPPRRARLRCPTMITQIATFMLRYLDVLCAEGHHGRGRSAPAATTPASCGRSRAFASGVGALFLRAFEARRTRLPGDGLPGYEGRIPLALSRVPARPAGQWASVPVVAGAIAGSATG